MEVKLTNDFLKSFAQHVVVAEPEITLSEKIDEVWVELDKLQKIRAGMFEFEDKTVINNTIYPYARRYRQLLIAKLGYPEQLSFDAFKLRRADGLPTFMMIDVDLRERIFGIAFNSHWVEFRPNTVPDKVKAQMDDVIETLKKRTTGWKAPEKTSIHAELSGNIPDDVRPLIRAAKDATIDNMKVFDKIFIVAEAPEWKFDSMPKAKTDPLVVGQDWKFKDLYLITSYDPTDLEAYLREQFTAKFE